jgi:ribonuclease P protein component
LNSLHAHSLRKHEILRARNHTAHLFKSGRSVRGSFLTIIYTAFNDETAYVGRGDAVLFAVGKKNVPSAVMRNRIKRLMREAYRLEKPFRSIFLMPHVEMASGPFRIAFIYTGRRKAIPGLDAFRSEMRTLMKNTGIV